MAVVCGLKKCRAPTGHLAQLLSKRVLRHLGGARGASGIVRHAASAGGAFYLRYAGPKGISCQENLNLLRGTLTVDVVSPL